MKKSFSIFLVIILVMSFANVAFAEEDATPYVTYSKTVVQTHTANLYCSQIGASITVGYKVVGYYTYDANTGAIKSAYLCEVPETWLISAPPPIYNARWRLDVKQLSTSQSIASNGSKATFTTTIVFNLVNQYASVDIEVFTLPPTSSATIAYAQ